MYLKLNPMIKQILFAFCVFIFPTQLFATIYTVSADPIRPAQYTTLNDARNAASNDDTIQWYGNVYPGQLNLNKRLTIIGNSTIPDNQMPNIVLEAGAGNSNIISGKYYSISRGSSLSTDQVCYVRNCYTNIVGALGWTVTNCVLGNLTNVVGDGSNSVFRNCLFINKLPSDELGNSIDINTTNSGNLLIDHCVLYGTLNFNHSSDLVQVIFSNCIFKEIFPTSCFPTTTLFNNNLFVNLTFDGAQYCGPQVLANNIMNAPNPFINPSETFVNTMNFQLAPGSAGSNAASDGSDMGLHGGIDAWPTSYQYTLYVPGMPVVASLSLQNHIIGISDSLQMNATGTIPSNE